MRIIKDNIKVLALKAIAILCIASACYYTGRNIMLFADSQLQRVIIFETDDSIMNVVRELNIYIDNHESNYSSYTNRVNYLGNENIHKYGHSGQFMIELMVNNKTIKYKFTLSKRKNKCQMALESINSTDIYNIRTQELIYYLFWFERKFLDTLQVDDPIIEIPLWKDCLREINSIIFTGSNSTKGVESTSKK